MFVSERLLARLAKLRKQNRDAPEEEQVSLVRDAFLGMVSGLPAEMAQDLYELITDRIRERSSGERTFFEDAEYLADVADLFALQYDEENDPIRPDDWPLIGDIVNDYAGELDMETVSYVMGLVVDHHGV